MKVVAKLFAIAAITLSCAAHAADTVPRKEVTLDTGKGGIKFTVSVPDFADGPYDFGKNPNPKVTNVTKNFMYGEVMYNAALGESGVIVYQASLARTLVLNKGDQAITAEHLASEMIKQAGFEGRATTIDCPPAPIQGASMACYKMSGDAVFDGKAKPEKRANVIVAVAFDNNKQGYTLMGTVVERSVEKFNADPDAFVIKAGKALTNVWKNSTVKLN